MLYRSYTVSFSFFIVLLALFSFTTGCDSGGNNNSAELSEPIEDDGETQTTDRDASQDNPSKDAANDDDEDYRVVGRFSKVGDEEEEDPDDAEDDSQESSEENGQDTEQDNPLETEKDTSISDKDEPDKDESDENGSELVESALSKKASAIFLHRNVGEIIYTGAWSSYDVAAEIDQYNQTNGTQYKMYHEWYPSISGYEGSNDPYDYWNLWVNENCFGNCESEVPLEELAADYDVIIFTHFPYVSDMIQGDESADVTSTVRTTPNYTAQYNAIKDRLHEFPKNRFLVWTFPALLDDGNPSSDISANLADDFTNWVIDKWDEKGDNIYIFDFRTLQTGGGLFAIPRNVQFYGEEDLHPSERFAKETIPKFAQRIIDVIEGVADSTSLTGK